MRVGEETSEWIDIEQGLRQGSVLSPDSFSLYTQLVMQELNWLEGIKIGGKNVNNTRYADYMVFIAHSEEKLQELVSTLDEECRRMGLTKNTVKTEAM